MLAPGVMLYLGPAGAAAPHAHHAVQVVHGLDGPIELTVGGRTLRTTAGIVAPDVPHAFDARGGRVALVLVDPHGPRGAALVRRAHRTADGAVAVVEAPPPDPDPDRALAWCEDLLASLGGRAEDAVPPSPVVAAALEYLVGAVAGRPALTAAARHAHVSPSRLTHTFTRQVGIPFRRYVLWLRLRRAAGLVQEGATLTRAATEAGFSDSAHLTRVFRANFGLPPSAVLSRAVPAGTFKPAADRHA